MSDLLRCAACGGAVVWDAARVGAACLFCGSLALELQPPGDEPIPLPHAHLPAIIDLAQADRRFRTWASSSWFRPAALRRTAITLQPLSIPAWRFDSELETHWAGLGRAPTRSGKQPHSGVERLRLQHMVPASAGLTPAELRGLQPFDEALAIPWIEPDAAQSGAPIWEPPALSERGARALAHRDLAQEHRRLISRERGLLRCHVSPLITDHDLRLLMLPIYIGVFRHRERAWRFVINAQTGALIGEAPLDRRKVLAVVLGAVVLALLLALVWRWSG